MTMGLPPDGSVRLVVVVETARSLGDDEAARGDDDPFPVLPTHLFDQAKTGQPRAGRDTEDFAAAAHIDETAAGAEHRPAGYARIPVFGVCGNLRGGPRWRQR